MPQSRRKRPTNLSLAPARLAFAHGYAEAHATSLSELVENLLGALEQVAHPSLKTAVTDPLDGILLGTQLAELDKQALRRARHEARLSR
jgi:hypothetical protein